MSICSQCKFENPEANKYCQSCGISLNHKICSQCHGTISIEAITCDFCGADNHTDNHTMLWAIISQPKADRMKNNIGRKYKIKIENLSNIVAKESKQALLTPPVLSDDRDISNRYIISEIFDLQNYLNSTSAEFNKFIQGKVIDQHPRKKSHLASLQKQQADIFAELGENSSNSYLSVARYWNSIGLPAHALPYLILEKYTPVVPQIYDAWQQPNRGVVLLQDRSQLQLLTQLWSQQELPLLQIIWFLDKMATLWQPLQQINCASSLLIDHNLRIDEDGAFCLQQLYIDEIDNPPTLKDLAKTWQLCFAQSNLDKLNNLDRLLDRVISEEIIEVEQLRQELHSLGFGEDEIKSFDIHSNYSDVNIPQSQPNNLESHNSEATEPENFFDEEMMYSSEFEEQATAMLPMQLRDVTYASYTDIGSQRDHNEDFFGVKSSIEKVENNTEKNLSVRGLYLVCDGMGGHAAGEVASAMAVENLQQYFQSKWQQDLPDRETIEKGILLTNKALYQTNINNSRSGSGRMGTTLVMALLQDTELAIAHVGDSRIYRITRKQGLEQLTLDHEVGQREINRGVEPDIAYGRPDAYQLTQALGPRENNYVRPDIQFMSATEDCLLLLCSDGLCDNNLLEKNWQQYLKPLISSSANLQEGLFELVNFANEHNGHDNITAILVRIKLKPDF